MSVALVDGVASPDSIGFAIAEALVAAGWEVQVTARPHRVDACRERAEQLGVVLHAVDARLDSVVSSLDRLDALVHTRVHAPADVLGQPLLEVSSEAFGAVVQGSAWSLVEAVRATAPLLHASAAGRVVTLTSPLSGRTSPAYHVAGIAKAALEASVRYLAFELGRAGTTVNGVSFPLIATTAARATVGPVADRSVAHLAKRTPTGRATTAADVAATVLWLASPAAAQVTGQILTVDGGVGQLYF